MTGRKRRRGTAWPASRAARAADPPPWVLRRRLLLRGLFQIRCCCRLDAAASAAPTASLPAMATSSSFNGDCFDAGCRGPARLVQARSGVISRPAAGRPTPWRILHVLLDDFIGDLALLGEVELTALSGPAPAFRGNFARRRGKAAAEPVEPVDGQEARYAIAQFLPKPS